MVDISCMEILNSIYDGVYFVDLQGKITFWNRGAEKITGFESSEVLGSACSDNILVHVDCKGCCLCLGKCPMAKTIKDGETREEEVYLRHKNGYRVPVSVRVSPLRDTSGKIFGGVQIFNDFSSSASLLDQLEQFRTLSLMDSLTGLINRRYAEIYLQGRINEMNKYGRSFFGVLFLDIDHFKNVNDTFGHHVGDEVLKMVSMTLKKGINGSGIVCRWGGEEFMAVISADSNNKLYSIAERLRLLIGQSAFNTGKENISVTMSIGATLADMNDTPDTLVKRADMLMFESKRSGRNKVTIK
ncbi:MAG: diguanylate cyclase [Bacillota bacterium]